MDVRPVDSLAEFRGAMAVNRAAWRDAYARILPDEVLRRIAVPAGERLRERYADARREGQQFLVAADPATGAEGDQVEISGFAQFVWRPKLSKPFVGDDEAGLRALYVDPERQGEGIGSRVLRHGIDRLPADTEAVVLETFRDNDAARGFYEARGFTSRTEATFEVDGKSYPTVVYEKQI